MTITIDYDNQQPSLKYLSRLNDSAHDAHEITASYKLGR